MTATSTTLTLTTEEDTSHLGAALSRYAKPGDCLLLRGQIGAGKSALARAFIRSLLGPDTDVPSPTFTLVQTYEAGDVEIWHADLYRLSDPQEAIELGLTDAFDTAICLIEWPELLGDLAPADSLDIHLEVAEDSHLATFTFGDAWRDRMAQVQIDAV